MTKTLRQDITHHFWPEWHQMYKSSIQFTFDLWYRNLSRIVLSKSDYHIISTAKVTNLHVRVVLFIVAIRAQKYTYEVYILSEKNKKISICNRWIKYYELGEMTSLLALIKCMIVSTWCYHHISAHLPQSNPTSIWNPTALYVLTLN